MEYLMTYLLQLNHNKKQFLIYNSFKRLKAFSQTNKNYINATNSSEK